MRQVAFFLLLILATGCRTRSLFSVPSGRYRAAVIADRGVLLLAPPVPSRYKPDQELQVTLILPGKYRSDKKTGCTIREDGFALLPGARAHANTLTLVLPALQDWQALLNAAQDAKVAEHVRSSLDAFMQGVNGLVEKGCLPAGIAEPLRTLIVESIPLQPQQTLYNFCEYWMGRSTLDLKPNLRLKVQRAYFDEKAVSEPRSLKHYLGTSTIYYRVRQLPSGLSRLDRGKVETQTDSTSRFVIDNFDASLAQSVKPMPVHRLILFTEFVSQQIKRPALIISASNSEALDKATAVLQTNPALSCVQVEKEDGVKCVSFFGEVTVSPEIRIFDEGHAKYVPLGTTLANVIGNRASTDKHAWKLLRLFHQEYAEVEFPAGSQSANSLTLIGGDKIVWK